MVIQVNNGLLNIVNAKYAESEPSGIMHLYSDNETRILRVTILTSGVIIYSKNAEVQTTDWASFLN